MKENDFQLVAAGQARSEIFMSDFNSKLSYKEKLLLSQPAERGREGESEMISSRKQRDEGDHWIEWEEGREGRSD